MKKNLLALSAFLLLFDFSFGQLEGAIKFAKSIKEFIDKHENLKPRAINYQGQDLDISELKKLASLPTYEEAISKLLSVMQGPIQKLMGTMKAVPNKLVRTIDAVKESKN